MNRLDATYNHLKLMGEYGATGMELIQHGSGVDYRKRISELRRDEYTITDRWERSGNGNYKRYILQED